jgi:hypothetical protein
LSPPGAVLTAAEAEPLIETGTLDRNEDNPVCVLSLPGKPLPRVTTRVARGLIHKGLAKIENARGPRLRTIRLLVDPSELERLSPSPDRSGDGYRKQDIEHSVPRLRATDWARIEHTLKVFGTDVISGLDHHMVSAGRRPTCASSRSVPAPLEYDYDFTALEFYRKKNAREAARNK